MMNLPQVQRKVAAKPAEVEEDDVAARNRSKFEVFAHTIKQIVDRNHSDWAVQLAKACEDVEIRYQVVPGDAYAFLLASYLAQVSLHNARFLWKRVPADMKQSRPELGALWNAGIHMWNRCHAEVYAALDAFPWEGLIASVVLRIKGNYRQHVCSLLEKAYSSIPWEMAVGALGCASREEIVKVVGARGWLCHDAHFVTPKPRGPIKDTQEHLELFDRLNHLMMHLEH